MSKYTKEMLEPIVLESTSVAQVMIKLGLKPNGGNQTYMRKRLKRLEVDFSHFLGQRIAKGKPSFARKSWQEILVLRKTHYKEEASRLRRALIEFGREYKCEECSIQDEWNGRKLVLQIDHKNGNPLDNSPQNLRFLCPNCHSQTSNWGSKKCPCGVMVAAPASEAGTARFTGSNPVMDTNVRVAE